MRATPIPIARPFVGEEEETAAREVLRSGWLMQGPKVAEFEQAFAARVGASEAVAVSSGTTAIALALIALGVAAGDEVICPSLSFIATANAIVHAGAKPVFADVDPRTLNLDPESVRVAITPRTRAILAVHQLGLPAELDALLALSRERGLILVEDAACAIGASYHNLPIGRPHGAAACFSFHPRKILTTGEGGMITTADPALAARLRALRNHGLDGGAYPAVGFNARMTDLQAAIGRVQLGRLDAFLESRRAQAARYQAALASVAGVALFEPPADRAPNFQSYVVRVRAGRKARDQVMATLAGEGIATRPGVMAAHREPAHAGFATAALPHTERAADETLALPIFFQLTGEEQDQVIAALERAVK
jgi:perosamine synthetase